MKQTMNLEELIIMMYDVDILKFGEFTMRTGEMTPVYVDMRVMWSYPSIVRAVCEIIWNKIDEEIQESNHICGLPYQGIPIATCLSTKHDIPMLLKRKAPKKYGTCKSIEGHFKKGDKVLIIDDVLMTGSTFLEEIQNFQAEGLEVAGAVCFFDREQGGYERIQKCANVKVYCCVTLSQTFEYLLKAGKLKQDIIDKTMKYIQSNRFDTPEYMEDY